MRSHTSDWFEVKFQYAKTQEDGQQKNVTELYVVDALSFGEAEETIVKEMQHYVSGDYKVKNITPANYHEIFFSDVDKDDKWYKAKLTFITIDEKTEKEKKSIVNYLVQASTTEEAQKHINEVMDSTMIDYEITAITETKIVDVFEHDNKGEQPSDAPKKSNGHIDEFE